LRAAQIDVLHFNILRYAGRTVPGRLRSNDILKFLLPKEFDKIEIINKIYSRSLCCSALLKLKDINIRAFHAFGLHFVLAALAENYAGDARDMAEYAFRPYTLRQHAQEAVALYVGLAQLPDCFVRWGHSRAVADFAQYRFRTELTLALGRAQRFAKEDETVSEAAVVQALRDSFVDEKSLLNALVIGVAANAAKLNTIYHAIFADTVFDPCPAYSLKKIEYTETDAAEVH
jgi:hypothetical protein